MESLAIEFERAMLFNSKPLEHALVCWIFSVLGKTATTTSFDILHEQPDLIYEACEKRGMNLFLPKGYLKEQNGLGGLVDAIKEFWKRQKGHNIFEISESFFRVLVGEDFVFEEEFETYILEFKQIEFGLMLYLLISFMMVRKRGGQSGMDELEIFYEQELFVGFATNINNLFNAIDSQWKDVVSNDNDQSGGGILSGDIGLLKKIEELKETISKLTSENKDLNQTVKGFDEVTAAKEEKIEELKREKNDIQRARNELLERIEGMKQEWLKEALEEKDNVSLHSFLEKGFYSEF